MRYAIKKKERKEKYEKLLLKIGQEKKMTKAEVLEMIKNKELELLKNYRVQFSFKFE